MAITGPPLNTSCREEKCMLNGIPVLGRNTINGPRQAQAEARAKANSGDSNASARWKDFAWDPWNRENLCRDIGDQPPSMAKHTKILIIGAGYGGLLFAVRLLQSGFCRQDILLVDSASGFGGTWYWNRYPGLRCDIESYIYMPLLEETGHIPSQKYVSGEELRQHATAIGHKWQLEDQTLFRTTLESLVWDESRAAWTGQGTQIIGSDVERSVTVNANFVIIATGSLGRPKVPNLAGIGDFQGHIFHTARWDYSLTGGSPEMPSLSQLKDKRVGIIGTGATAVQVIPELARWSKELYVFQRTPGDVGFQENEPTDVEWWAQEIHQRGPGWQRERAENFNSFVDNSRLDPANNMVNDGWTKFPSYSATIGGISNLDPDYRQRAQAMDRSRQEALRNHIREVVRNKTTADALQPTSYGWCKRPCFHDTYLNVYNLPHVKLIATRGEGVTALTRRGILHDSEEIELDFIILATGYDLKSLCPAVRAHIEITGRDGTSMAQKWATGVTTLHGVMIRDFPNLFFPGISQAGVAANQVYMFDRAADHVTYIIRTSLERQGSAGKISVEPTHEAQEEWAMQTIARAAGFAAAGDCPQRSYTMSSSRATTEKERITLSRQSPWGEGITQYVKILEQWRARGEMDGIDLVYR